MEQPTHQTKANLEKQAHIEETRMNLAQKLEKTEPEVSHPRAQTYDKPMLHKPPAKQKGPAIDTVNRPFETGAELHQREHHDKRSVIEKAHELGHSNVVQGAPQKGSHAVIEELPFPRTAPEGKNKHSGDRRQ